jgi:hypothetical protein
MGKQADTGQSIYLLSERGLCTRIRERSTASLSCQLFWRQAAESFIQMLRKLACA